MDEKIHSLLSLRARPAKAVTPSASVLASQLPEVVAWLREGMVGKSTSDDRLSSGKPGSKPPFRIAFMAAADREIECMSYWAACYDIPIVSRAWRVGGVVKGVASDDVSVVNELSVKMAEAFRVFTYDDVLDHPKFGIWQTRSSHYGIWPQLAALFQTTRFDEPTENNQMELL